MPFHKGESRTRPGRPRGPRNRATLLHARMAMQTGGCRNKRAIVSRLFFTMKIPTLTCGGANDVDVARSSEARSEDFPSRHDEDELNTLRWQRQALTMQDPDVTPLHPGYALAGTIAQSSDRLLDVQSDTCDRPTWLIGISAATPSPRHALKRLLPLANSAAQGEWSALPEYII